MWSNDEILTIVPQVAQQQNAVDCGIYTIFFGHTLAAGVSPGSIGYTEVSAAQDRIRIANRLNTGLWACVLNHKLLGLIPASPPHPASPALSSISVRPAVAATSLVSPPNSASSLPSPAPSSTSARPTVAGSPMVSSPVRVGRIVLLPDSSLQTPQLFFPARTLATVSETVTLEWCCESLFLDDNSKPSGQFTCSLERWQQAATVIQHLSIHHLAPVMWPAALAHWTHRRFRTFVFPSDTELHLHLESHLPDICRVLSGQPVESPFLNAVMEDYRSLATTVDLKRHGSFMWAQFP
ncbi:hypothetical protein B0H10DRAFT_1292925 [Mycena sp. CBHHK59/15]|nr:hypothetical protein B0H10DRAFT_1292925 [Mycena sp. CBHHK59/15]